MTIHRYHPNPEKSDPSDAKLFDDCERCDEQAEHLFGLDKRKLAWFWSAMHQVEREEQLPDRPLTNNERTVIRRMYYMAVLFERLSGVWPSPEVFLHLRVNENVR